MSDLTTVPTGKAVNPAPPWRGNRILSKPTKPSLALKMRQLQELFDRGLLSRAEFFERRERIEREQTTIRNRCWSAAWADAVIEGDVVRVRKPGDPIWGVRLGRVKLPERAVRCPDCKRQFPRNYFHNGKCLDCDPPIVAIKPQRGAGAFVWRDDHLDQQIDRGVNRENFWRAEDEAIAEREHAREAAVEQLRTVLTLRECQDLVASYYGGQKQYAVADRRKVTDRAIRANVARALRQLEAAGLPMPWKPKRRQMKAERWDPVMMGDLVSVNGKFTLHPKGTKRKMKTSDNIEGPERPKGRKRRDKYAILRAKS